LTIAKIDRLGSTRRTSSSTSISYSEFFDNVDSGLTYVENKTLIGKSRKQRIPSRNQLTWWWTVGIFPNHDADCC